MIRVLIILSTIQAQSTGPDDILHTIVTGVDKGNAYRRSVLLQAVTTIGQTSQKSSLKSLALIKLVDFLNLENQICYILRYHAFLEFYMKKQHIRSKFK
jgi:hypothetical protein